MNLNFVDYKTSLTKIVIKYFIILIILLLFDSIYFKMASNIHNKVFLNIKPKNIIIPSALISWSLLAISITILKPVTLKQSIIYGAFIGFIIYGVYNSPNYATIKSWTLDMCLYDTTWGMCLCTIGSIAAYYIFGTTYFNDTTNIPTNSNL